MSELAQKTIDVVANVFKSEHIELPLCISVVSASEGFELYSTRTCDQTEMESITILGLIAFEELKGSFSTRTNEHINILIFRTTSRECYVAPVSDNIWFIDPLDGTKAFLRGNLAFVCMSIAAWDETGLLAGVVYNPFTDMLYSSAKSSSAYLNGSVLPPPSTFPLKEARLLIDFSNRLPLGTQKQLAIADLDDVIGRSYRLGGGISQHLMLVAQGTLHGALFWGAGRKGKYWDIAAAALILERLGVKMTTLEGKAIHPTDKLFDQLIIARPKLHKEMIRWVEKLKKIDS